MYWIVDASHLDGVFRAPAQQTGSNLRCYALRLGPGEEIVSSLMKLVEEKGILAGFVMTCVGSVQKARLRLAQNENTGKNEASQG